MATTGDPNTPRLLGVHHVTAIAGDPQANVDFYAGVLGLRLVKRSVNQDDPGTYHLFYGDAAGSPGTELTYFPWPRGRRGRRGAGQWVAVGLAVPSSAMGYWVQRLREYGVSVTTAGRRGDEVVMAFADPDGLHLELVAGPQADRRPLLAPWEESPVPADFAIRGVHYVALSQAASQPTTDFLTGVLGFRQIAESSGRLRFETGDGGSGALLDLVNQRDGAPGRVAVGTVHHVAWRTPESAEQERWWNIIRNRGVGISPIIDRFWFTSIYFGEPGGALFEIATDGPGFTVDESPETLGSRLILPPWLEPQRAKIEAALPPLHLPESSNARSSASRSSESLTIANDPSGSRGHCDRSRSA